MDERAGAQPAPGTGAGWPGQGAGGGHVDGGNYPHGGGHAGGGDYLHGGGHAGAGLPDHVRWSAMTRDQIAAQAPGATLILPVAATEQHGPHLPTGTDALICEALAARTAVALRGRVPVVLAPLLPFGFSAHHQAFAGVLTLSAPTLASVLTELGAAAAASRFRRLFFLNAHGGNDELIRVAARQLALAHEVRVGACSYWAVAAAALARAGVSEDLGPVPGHAGAFETALVLALRPDLVRRGRSPGRPSGSLHPARPGVFAQAAGEWARMGGFTDPPDAATPEAGRRLLDLIVGELAEAVAAFHEVD